MPEIIVKLGDSIVQKNIFVKETIRIGRVPDNEIMVENLAVSRYHAAIEYDDGRYILTDLESSNGTFVNGVRIKKTELQDRDVITIGKHKLYFYDHRAMAEPKPRPVIVDIERTMLMDASPAVPLQAELEVIKGRQEGTRFALNGAQSSLGKGAFNDIQLTDWFVSKVHAVIERHGGQYLIRDMGSWRHTYVNGAVTQEAPLADGDTIQLGPSVQLAFRLVRTDAAPLAAARVPVELGQIAPSQPTSEPAQERGEATSKVWRPRYVEWRDPEEAPAEEPNTRGQLTPEADEEAGQAHEPIQEREPADEPEDKGNPPRFLENPERGGWGEEKYDPLNGSGFFTLQPAANGGTGDSLGDQDNPPSWTDAPAPRETLPASSLLDDCTLDELDDVESPEANPEAPVDSVNLPIPGAPDILDGLEELDGLDALDAPEREWTEPEPQPESANPPTEAGPGPEDVSVEPLPVPEPPPGRPGADRRSSALEALALALGLDEVEAEEVTDCAKEHAMTEEPTNRWTSPPEAVNNDPDIAPDEVPWESPEEIPASQPAPGWAPLVPREEEASGAPTDEAPLPAADPEESATDAGGGCVGQDADPEILREILLWERALSNKNPIIRKQAARQLLKLTGKEYDYS